MNSQLPIPFIDLAAQRRRLGDRIEKAVREVMDHGRFILGPEVDRLEKDLCEFSGAKNAITCANGTDALVLAMMALEIGEGDAILLPSFTFSASAESVVLAGATPVFVDICPDTLNIDPAGLLAGFEEARTAGLRPRAVMTVDLFGQPADYSSIAGFCGEKGLLLIADAAQSFGASYQGARVGTLATITTTSFFPSKPFGCYGDGGAILTDDEGVADILRSLRVHGQGSDKYDNVRIGMNSRLDTLQAAILIEKLSILKDEIGARQDVAARYKHGLENRVISPNVTDGIVSAWALYTIRLPAARRDAVQDGLLELGVPTVVYYPRPLHSQPAYAEYPAIDLPESEAACSQVLSLPMHPYLEEAVQDLIIEGVNKLI